MTNEKQDNSKFGIDYKKLFDCTRSQYRRIVVTNAPYQAELDGTVEEYLERKRRILEWLNS